MSLHDEILNQGRDRLSERFADPGAEFRGKPFWSWNGELQKEELIRQVGVLKEMGMGGFFMHSRAGLATEYLGEEWFDLINAVADAGEAVGLEAWLYDEDRWPSGSAGGKVTVDPQYRMKSLCLQERRTDDFVWRDEIYLAFLAKVDGLNLYEYTQLFAASDISAIRKQSNDSSPGEWKVLEFTIVPDECSSNYNGTTYIDTMNRKAVDRFIELTHEEYAKHCGDRLGRSIKGIFTDEPHRGQAMDHRTVRDSLMRCPTAWTDDLPEEFRKRYGYDPIPVLPELFYFPQGRRVSPIKLHYFDLTDHLFLERFAIPVKEWCEAHGFVFTGHVLHEDSFSAQSAPHGSLMRFYEHMDYPGVDVLTEGNRCYWIVKQLASAARQLGKKWMLSELYGCTGWQFDFKSHKNVGDWQALFGINVRCHHLSWYTMEGEAKRDYPASILHQSAWYPDYDLVESYFARFGVVMTEGRPACEILVLNAIESVWCQAYAGWVSWVSTTDPEIRRLEEHYERLFHMLADNQIDFDYGEEEMMSRLASVEADGNGVSLRVGQATYRTVVVSGMVTMRDSTLRLLREFMDKGGCVIFCGDPPEYADALPSDLPKELANHPNAKKIPFEEEPLFWAIQSRLSCAVAVRRFEGAKIAKSVFAQIRICEEDGLRFLALLNTDRENGTGEVEVELHGFTCYGAELWDLTTGKRFDAASAVAIEDDRVIFRTSLLPGEARVYAFVDYPFAEGSLPTLPTEQTVRTVDFTDPVEYRPGEENVCVLDYARWKWNDGQWQDEQEILKVDAALRDSLGLERRGGEMLQPWYAKKFDTREYGSLELEYEFYADTLPQGAVTLAGERPDLCEYRLNGVLLAPSDDGGFWVDACFKRMDVPAGALKLGRNVVTLKTTFKRTTNLEALYLLGDFGVSLDERKRTLTKLPERIGFVPLPRVGMPFYSGQITYRIPSAALDANGIRPKPGERVFLSPIAFCGALVKVSPAGDPSRVRKTGWEPYEIDVTDFLSEGVGLDVTLILTRRNTFGPLHRYPKLQGAYGPFSFVSEGEGWRDSYMLLDTGIQGGIRFHIRAKESE